MTKTVSRGRPRQTLIYAACLALALAHAPTLPAPAGQRPPARRSGVELRESAYRANNLGVALLEQFKHVEGAEQFRRALSLDPGLTLARINLAVALFNVPDLAGALAAARDAARAAPGAPQPRYILGLVARQQNRTEDALAEFLRVHKMDPRDVGANVNLGQIYAQQRRYVEAVAHFRAASEAEPYNGTALYNLANALLRSGEREEGQRLLGKFQELRESGAATAIGNNYLEQGRYAEAVTSTGAEPGLVSVATPRVAFVEATAETFGRTSGPAPPGKKVPAVGGRRAADGDARRFAESLGGGLTLFDMDGDGDLDLLDLAPRSTRLYRNDRGRFTDVTAAAGDLSAAFDGVNIGAVAGDYDNDGLEDLFVLRLGGPALYRNEGGGKFSERSAAAGLPAYGDFALSAAFADVDHDGDLDIFVAGFAATGGLRLDRFGRAGGLGGAPNMLLRNNGDGTFADVTAASGVRGEGRAAVGVVPTDYDNRRDVDLLVVNYGAGPALYRNMRDATFRDVAAEAGLRLQGDFTAAAAGDVNKDHFTDFFFARAGGPGSLALSDGRGGFGARSLRTAHGAEGRHVSYKRDAAQFLDYDNDGLLDLVTIEDLGSGGELRVMRNAGSRWVDVSRRAAGARSSRAGARLFAGVLAAGDADGDGDTDLFARSPDGGLVFLRNEGGSRNRSVRVRLAGKVSNRSGVGAKVEARAGSLQQKFELYSAVPAPAPADVLFGLGPRRSADAVRVIWPSGVVQAETGAHGGEGTQALARVGPGTLAVTELDRKPSSCPYLYAWDGERFRFVTDFMGGGELGYYVAPGVRAAPDPDEYVRIPPGLLKEKDGRLELRVTNELEEALFIDRLQLVAVAHPAGTDVYPNEGLGNPTSSEFRLYVTRGARTPRAAGDARGRDLLGKVTYLDRNYADGFPLKRIRGYAEEHALVLDLGEEKGEASDGGRALLLMTGWTDYAFSSDNVAASQAGLGLSPPKLQVRDAAGRWRTVIENIGVPVGRPQTVAVDLTGKFLSARREVRVVTNMRIYWDQVLVADTGGGAEARVERLDAAEATLRWRGFSAEVSPDGREPFVYDYARVTDVSPWKVLPGRYTRFGDVRELLAAVDDMFVVSRPGDEIALSFDPAALSPLPAGWTRTFLLCTDGFSKEMDINSASPHTLAPLPFRAMKEYPYGAPEAYPATRRHLDYLERYNTRVVVAPLPTLAGGR